MKKLASLLLGIALVLTLSGCDKKESENPDIKTPDKEVEVEKIDNHLPYDLDQSLEAPIDALWNEWMANGKVPGGVVLAAHNGKIIYEKAYGYAELAEADYEAKGSTYANPVYKPLDNPREMKVDTMFDLASVTKVMATTQSIMKLVSDGKINVTDKVVKYLPEFGRNGKENITIDQLLTHTSGLPQWEATFLYCDNKEEQLEYIYDLELIPEFVEDGIGKKWYHYSDFSFMTLGFIVEEVSGMDMDEFAYENIYKPLGLEHTTYVPLEHGFTREDIAATSMGNAYEYRMVDEVNYPGLGYDCEKDAEAFKHFKGWRQGALVGEVNDGNTGMGGKGIAGHAGLFSNVQDLAVIGQMMLNGGEINGTRIYSEDVVDLFTTKQTHTDVISEEFGYGFKLDQSWMGDSATEKVYGHDGFTGTYVIMDPEHDLEIIVLTNKMQSGFRNKEGENHNLYMNVSPLVKQTSNIIREHLGF